MSAAAATGWSAGARRLQVAMRNTAGYPMGTLTTPDTVPNDTTTSAHVISGLRSLTHPEKTVTRAFDRGDQKTYGQMYLGVEDFGEGSFEVGAEDEVFDALIKKTVVDVAIATDMAVVAGNEGEADPPPMFIIATTRKQLRDGSFWYDNQIYQNVQISKPKPADVSQNGGESPNPLTYNFAPSLSERMITGHLFSATDLEVLEDEDTYIKIRSKYPLAVTTFKADGTEDEVQLPFLPVLSGATGAAQNIVTKNGVTLAVTSISTTTGLVTLAAPGSAGDIFVIIYQTNFTPAA
jgi:hypothetical protein